MVARCPDGRTRRLIRSRTLVASAVALATLGAIANAWWMGKLRCLPAHLALTRSRSADVRAFGCDGLRLYRHEPERSRAAATLVGCLSDPDRWVRANAADSLEALDYREAGPRMVILMRDPEPLVRGEAIEVLGTWQDTAALPELQRIVAHLPDEGDSWVRAAAVRALGRYRLPGSLPAIEAALNGPDELVGREAIEALAAIGTEQAWSAIRRKASGSGLGAETAREALSRAPIRSRQSP
jgi:HEAT repeat protein